MKSPGQLLHASICASADVYIAGSYWKRMTIEQRQSWEDSARAIYQMHLNCFPSYLGGSAK